MKWLENLNELSHIVHDVVQSEGSCEVSKNPPRHIHARANDCISDPWTTENYGQHWLSKRTLLIVFSFSFLSLNVCWVERDHINILLSFCLFPSIWLILNWSKMKMLEFCEWLVLIQIILDFFILKNGTLLISRNY